VWLILLTIITNADVVASGLIVGKHIGGIVRQWVRTARAGFAASVVAVFFAGRAERRGEQD